MADQRGGQPVLRSTDSTAAAQMKRHCPAATVRAAGLRRGVVGCMHIVTESPLQAAAWLVLCCCHCCCGAVSAQRAAACWRVLVLVCVRALSALQHACGVVCYTSGASLVTSRRVPRRPQYPSHRRRRHEREPDAVRPAERGAHEPVGRAIRVQPPAAWQHPVALGGERFA